MFEEDKQSKKDYGKEYSKNMWLRRQAKKKEDMKEYSKEYR